MQSLLFVSRHAADLTELPLEMYRIEQTCRRRNAELGVTGGLACTRRHFAGILEGEEPVVGQLMRSIERDKRHESCTVIETRAIPAREFTAWSVCYSGTSLFVEKLVAPLIAEPAPDGAQKLRHFIRELAT